MKKIPVFALLFVTILTSCGSTYPDVDVVTSIFPHYDLVRQLSRDTDLSYSIVVPPGVELHTYRPTPKQTAQIHHAQMFIYTSDTIETWVTSISLEKTQVINVEKSLAFEEEGHDHEDAHAHSAHYWTSPANYIDELTFLTNELSNLSPEYETTFRNNANDYQSQLLLTSNQFKDDLSTVVHPQLYLIGHNAMADFAEYFGIEIISLVEDIKPDADVTPAQLGRLIDEIVASGATSIFVEELAAPIIAETIQNELRMKHHREIEIRELHGYHNVSLNDYSAGVTYLDLLERNITNIKEGIL